MKLSKWDPQASALAAYWSGDDTAQLTIKSVLGTTDVPVDIYFRGLDDMPMAELYAIQLASGKVLDIGAGSGSHAIAIQDMGLQVSALEIHPTMCDIMIERGVEQVILSDFWTHKPAAPYDTLLLMMNGIGFVGQEHQLPNFFAACEKLLSAKGQILLDSTDLSINVAAIKERNPQPSYWGELDYQMAFRDQWGLPFTWLYLDTKRLQRHATQAGWQAQLIYEGEDGHYLARIIKK